MKLKKMLVAGVAAAVLVSTTLGVSAAPLKSSSVTLKDIFDAEYYASQYPDLQEAFGDDEKMLYQHFIDYGLSEGRNMSPILDVVAYREAYGDLDEAFGDDWDKYVEHFFAFGAGEGREEGVLFDPIQYAASYSDIDEAFGDDLVAIAKHYMAFGMDEERQEGTSKGYESISALKEEERKQEQYKQATAPAPGETPDTPESSAPEETPDTPENPAPEETPGTPENPAPEETPDTPENPAPEETPGTPENPAPGETPDTPEDGLTAEAVYSAMMALQTKYPEGMSWTDENRSYVWYAIPNTITTGTGCAAFAFELSDAAFGTEAPAVKVTDVTQIRVGDVVRVNNDTHFVIILKIADNGDVTVAEGNFNSSVHWGRVIEKEAFEEAFDYLYTRY